MADDEYGDDQFVADENSNDGEGKELEFTYDLDNNMKIDIDKVREKRQ